MKPFNKISKQRKKRLAKRIADLLEKMAAAGIIGAAIQENYISLLISFLCVFYLVYFEIFKGEENEL